MAWNLFIVLGTAVAYLAAVAFLLPWAIGAICVLFPAKDAGSAPPSGHGWVAPNAKER